MFEAIRIDNSSHFFSSIHLRSLFFSGWCDFDAIIMQLQCMDARLDTLTDELCQVNTRVSRIARQQACLCGFVESLSPPFEASEDDDDDEDRDARSSNADKMFT